MPASCRESEQAFAPGRYPDEVIVEHGSVIPELPPWLRQRVASKLFGIWLEKIPIFASLEPATLLELFSHVSKVKVTDGFSIVKKGQPSTCLYFVEEGACQVLSGPDQVKGYLKAGNFFGDNSLLNSTYVLM